MHSALTLNGLQIIILFDIEFSKKMLLKFSSVNNRNSAAPFIDSLLQMNFREAALVVTHA